MVCGSNGQDSERTSDSERISGNRSRIAEALTYDSLTPAAHGHKLPHALTEWIGVRCTPEAFGFDGPLVSPIFVEALTGCVVVVLIPGDNGFEETGSGPHRHHASDLSPKCREQLACAWQSACRVVS